MHRESTVEIRGVEVERLSCGCSPIHSSGRSRCVVAKELHARVMKLDAECRKAPAGRERMDLMGKKAVAYDAYRVHLGGLPVAVSL